MVKELFDVVMRDYQKIPLKNYTKSEIAEFYGIHINTLKNWLIKVKLHSEIKHKRMLSLVEVELIFNKLGWPEK